MRRLQRRLSSSILPDESAIVVEPRDSFSEEGAQVANRFIDNHMIASAIAATFGIPGLFFLQPDANYNYNPYLYSATLPDSVDELRPRKAEFYDVTRSSDRYIDLAGPFDTWGNDRKALMTFITVPASTSIWPSTSPT